MVRVLERIRPNRYTTIQVSSVLLPGLLLLIEIGYASIPSSYRSSLWEVFRHVSDRSQGIKGGVIVLVALLAVLFAYAIGFLARRLSFFLLEVAQNILGKKRLTRFFRTPGEDDVLDMFAEFFPENSEKPWVAEHPAVFKSVAGPAEGQEGATRSIAVAGQWFGYFKAFVQGADERFSIDWAEFEVNTMASLIAPTAGGALVILDLASPQIGISWRVGVVCAIILVMLLSIIRIRYDERIDAARKFVLTNVVPPWPREEGQRSRTAGS